MRKRCRLEFAKDVNDDKEDEQSHSPLLGPRAKTLRAREAFQRTFLPACAPRRVRRPSCASSWRRCRCVLIEFQ